jgi:hypothetical protein
VWADAFRPAVLASLERRFADRDDTTDAAPGVPADVGAHT